MTSEKAEGPAADRTPRTATDTTQAAESYDIPAHRLHPAEADLRFVVNTIRRDRHHWWLYTWDGRKQRELLERLRRCAA